MKRLYWIVALVSASVLAIAMTALAVAGLFGEARLLPIAGSWFLFLIVLVLFMVSGKGAGGAHEEPSLEIRLIQAAGFDERFVIKNTSHVDAFDIDLKVVGAGQNPIPTAVAMHHLPIDRINPGGLYEIPISLSADAGIEFDVVATWKNRRHKGFKSRKWVGLTKVKPGGSQAL